jgi:hypothetical protein
MRIVDKLRLAAAWNVVTTAKTPLDKALAFVAALRLSADKTTTTKDNAVLDHVEKILRTPEGAAIINWFAKVSGEIT